MSNPEFIGPISIKSADGTSHGYVTINPGGDGYTGYIDIYREGGTRIGYIGFEDFTGSDANLAINLENGAKLMINGDVVINGNVSANNIPPPEG